MPRFRMSVSTLIEEFGALTAGAGPQSEHVAVSVEADADRGWGSRPLAGEDFGEMSGDPALANSDHGSDSGEYETTSPHEFEVLSKASST